MSETRDPNETYVDRKIRSHITTKDGKSFVSPRGIGAINQAMKTGELIFAFRSGPYEHSRRFWIAPSYIVYVLEITENQPATG